MTVRDGDWELVEWDPWTGRTVWTRYNGRDLEIREDYPIDSILKSNAQARNEARRDWKGDYHLVASIPLPLLFGADQFRPLQEAFREDDQKWIRRWLNDSDHRAFRVKEGQL